jgi:hypothetical protein
VNSQHIAVKQWLPAKVTKLIKNKMVNPSTLTTAKSSRKFANHNRQLLGQSLFVCGIHKALNSCHNHLRRQRCQDQSGQFADN